MAEEEFGDLQAARRELAAVDRHRRRRERIGLALDTLGQDLRHAVRTLRRSPAFTVTALATLVIGIGGAVTIFAVVNGVLLSPLPYPDPGRLVGAWHDFPPIGMRHGSQAAITFWTYQAQARTITGIGIYTVGAANVAVRGRPEAPARLPSAPASASLFPVLGVSPILGRYYTEEEDRPGAAPVMLISEGLWRTTLGGDPGVVGRTLDVDGVSRQIVGVMPRSFRFPSASTELWFPLALDRGNPPGTAFSYNGVARLKPGVTPEEAQRDFAQVLPRVQDLYPAFVSGITTRQMLEQVQPRPVITPLHDDVTGGIAGTLWMMAAAATLLLLVACFNVANLTLVRFEARQRENAVRAALGAGTARLVRANVAESVALASLAATLGVSLAWAVVRALVAKGPADIPRLAELAVDWRTVLFALATGALAALAAGLVPALRTGRSGFALREGARGATAGRGQHRLRSALVAAQLALGLVVLGGSGLLLRTFQRLNAVRPGFAPEQVTTLWLSLPRARYQGDTAVVRFYQALVDSVAALPGVRAVGVTSRLPLVTRGMNENPLYPEGVPYEGKLPPLEIFGTVGGDYFRAMRIPLLAGRSFERMDTQREGDAIVSSRTAEVFWHDPTGRTVLGKRFRALPTGRWYTVVGVVGDAVDTALAAGPSSFVYFPEIVQEPSPTHLLARTMAVVVRTADPAAIAGQVQRIVRDLDPALPVFDVQPMTAVLRGATARLAFVILVLGGATLVTVLLGAIGLYGVMAYIVSLRRRELGIRIALGATPRGVAAATVRQGLALAGAGLVVGFLLFALAARLMRGLLFGVAADDPVTLAGATLVLLTLAALASWVPASRASRIDPAEALRAE